jgi:hypothetical protein
MDTKRFPTNAFARALFIAWIGVIVLVVVPWAGPLIF